MSRIRVLLIEDNRLLREGLAGLLNEQPDLHIVDALADAQDVVRHVQSTDAGVILLDLGLPSQNTLDVLADLRGRCPDAKVIVMDLLPLQTDVMDFVGAGVSGFLVKDVAIEEVLRTIRSVAAGQQVLPIPLTASLFSQIVAHTSKRRSSALQESVRMTPREGEVIALIADGLSNKEIAVRLNLATHTVKSHVHNILEKLALRTRLQVAAYAHDHGVEQRSSQKS